MNLTNATLFIKNKSILRCFKLVLKMNCKMHYYLSMTNTIYISVVHLIIYCILYSRLNHMLDTNKFEDMLLLIPIAIHLVYLQDALCNDHGIACNI